MRTIRAYDDGSERRALNVRLIKQHRHRQAAQLCTGLVGGDEYTVLGGGHHLREETLAAGRVAHFHVEFVEVVRRLHWVSASQVRVRLCHLWLPLYVL